MVETYRIDLNQQRTVELKPAVLADGQDAARVGRHEVVAIYGNVQPDRQTPSRGIYVRDGADYDHAWLEDPVWELHAGEIHSHALAHAGSNRIEGITH